MLEEQWGGSAIDVALDEKSEKEYTGVVYLPSVPAVEILLENVCFEVKSRNHRGKRVRLLNDVCCTLRSGQLVALMGSSGAGKTTLLDILAQRTKQGYLSGSVLVNGQRMSEEFKKMTSYMPQQDVMWGQLTVREQISFQADFRLPRSATAAERQKRVTAVMDKLNLQNCADTRIGGAGLKNEEVSGGERKRTSVGSELVTNPAVLLLDEPISGLDSLNAMQVVRMLRMLVDDGRLVICTIHQPSVEVFDLFDTLILLAKPSNDAGGNLAYFGPVKEAEKFFGAVCGVPVPPRVNPAAHYIEQVTPLTETQKDGTRVVLNQHKIEGIVAKFDEHVRPHVQRSVSERLAAQSTSMTAFHVELPRRISAWKEFSLLLRLHSLILIRTPRTSFTRLLQAAILSLLAGLIYLQLDTTQAGLQNRVGALFFLLNQVFMGCLMSVVFLFPLDRPIFLREHSNNAYSAFWYWQSKSLIEVPFDLIMAFIYGAFAYWMIGLQGGYHYAVYLATSMVTAMASSSIGFLIGSGVKEQSTAILITPIIMIPLMIFGGFFIQAGSIPVFLDWIKYISPFYYAFPLLVSNELTGLNFTCTPQQLVPFGVSSNGTVLYRCPFTTGEAYLGYIGFANVNYLLNFGLLGALILGYRLASLGLFLLLSRANS